MPENESKSIYPKLKIAFVSALLGAALSVAISVFVGYQWFFGVVLPVVILLLYAAIDKNDTLTNAENQQFADSIYFLGFLMTLIALTATLSDLSREDFDRLNIVTRFALALVTTIVGLTVRVYRTNFRSAYTESLAKAEQELEQGVIRFTRQIEVHSEVIEKILSRFEPSNYEAVFDGMDGLAQSIGKLHHQVNEHGDKYGAALAKSLDALKPLTNQHKLISETVSALGDLTAQLKAVGDGFESGRKSADELSNLFMNKNQLLLDSLRSIEEKLSTQNSEMANTVQQSRAVLNEVQEELLESVKYIRKAIAE